MKSFNQSCIFVCTKKGGCGACGAKKLVKGLKKLVKSEGLQKEYKVIESGCLGYCSREIATVTFPENLIFTRLSKKDAYRLLTKLETMKKYREIPELPKKNEATHSRVVNLLSH